MALVYPPGRHGQIPENIRSRLLRLSDNYLHFQFHYFDTLSDALSIPHLVKSAGDTGEFFFPVTILYANYPGLGKTVLKKYNADQISASITEYFGEDFDEGIQEGG